MATAKVHVACYCARVRFEVTLPVEHVGHCHCSNCRRAHGAGFWTFVTVRKERVRLVAGADALVPYSTETRAVRSFCKVCGTTLTYESPRWPGLIDFSRANFEQEIDTLPSRHTYADRSPDWCPILDELPRRGGATGVEPL